MSAEAEMVARYQRMASSRRRLRAPLIAIDRVIDLLELRHLAGRTALDDRVVREIEQLATVVPLTDAVRASADTKQLHSALLDLQEVVLEAVVPSRRLWTEQDEDEPARGARVRSSLPAYPWRGPGGSGPAERRSRPLTPAAGGGDGVV